ncbi:hypothetical protein ACPA9J_14040 [Pseudomonas aeruginosa]
MVAAILASKADIVGLMEIENDGYGRFSAIADLVNGLNASLPQGQRYAFVNPNRAKLGSDEIAVGLIYRGDKVRTYRSAAVLDSSVNPVFDDTRNRPTPAQTFQEINGGERPDHRGEPPEVEGLGLRRRPGHRRRPGQLQPDPGARAQALVDWLAGDPTGAKEPDRLIIGDLNSYAKEDPVNVIRGAGYTDLVARQAGAGRAIPTCSPGSPATLTTPRQRQPGAPGTRRGGVAHQRRRAPGAGLQRRVQDPSAAGQPGTTPSRTGPRPRPGGDRYRPAPGGDEEAPQAGSG